MVLVLLALHYRIGQRIDRERDDHASEDVVVVQVGQMCTYGGPRQWSLRRPVRRFIR